MTKGDTDASAVGDGDAAFVERMAGLTHNEVRPLYAHPAPAGETYRAGLQRAQKIVDEHGKGLSEAGRDDEACAFYAIAEAIRTLADRSINPAAIRAEADKLPAAPNADDEGDVAFNNWVLEEAFNLLEELRDGDMDGYTYDGIKAQDKIEAFAHAAIARVRPSAAAGAVEAAVLAEREACAAIADKEANRWQARKSAAVVADAIRARASHAPAQPTATAGGEA